MSSLRFLSVYVLGVFLLSAVSAESHYDDPETWTFPPEDNTTSPIDYIFFSNTSSEELDRLNEHFFGPEDTGGQGTTETPEDEGGQETTETPEDEGGQETTETPEDRGEQETTETPEDRGGHETTETPEDRGGQETTETPEDEGGQETTETPEDTGGHGTTETQEDSVENVASLPVSLEITTLLWSLMILVVLNWTQLRLTSS